MNPDWSGSLNKAVLDKRVVRTGQLRVWNKDAHSVCAGRTFLVVGFKEWDDADPTVVILEDGVVINDFYIAYVDSYSDVIEETPDGYSDVFFSVDDSIRRTQ